MHTLDKWPARVAGAIAALLVVAGTLALSAQVVTNPSVTGMTGTAVQVGSGGASASTNGTLDLQTSAAGVCTAADLVETTAYSYTLPANTLTATSRGLRIYTYGTTAANADVKTVRLYVGSNVFTVIGGAVNNLVWFTTNTYLRGGANVQQRMGIAGFGGTINVPTIVQMAESETAPILIKVTLQNGTAAASDICWRGTTVETIR